MNHHSEKNVDYRSLLEEAFLELRKMRLELEAIEQARTEPIAIIGMGCRFPGGADTPEKYWQLLRDGVDTITEIPATRWDLDAYYDPDPEVLGKMYTRYGAFLKDVDKFDPQFFGIAPREALGIDPQQRLLLEVSWEAMENAGLVPEQMSGSQTGIFMGLFMNDYDQFTVYTGDLRDIDAHGSLGSLRSMAAGRLAYAYDLQGPVMQIDTACSSALLAVHLACQSLRSKECHLALAGGVNLMLIPELPIGLSRLKAISADGHCKAFDASANGYVRGEGSGVVVLKRLSDAIADGDNILATIRGSAVNHDGRSNGISAPNGLAQEVVIRNALENAQVKADQIQYVEAHGTGTPLGDPIEALALGAVLCQGRSEKDRLIIGSVKTNLGHLEPASGIAGLIKVVLCLQHAQIPPHLHFKEPSPHIPWDKLVVPTQLTAWPSKNGERLAGISAFGMSGTNVHTIVAEAPSMPTEELSLQRPLHLLSLSAKSEQALLSLARRYEEFLATHPDAPLANICFTANTGRSHFAHRLAVVAKSHDNLREQLSGFAKGKETAGVIFGQLENINPPKIAFLFTGQGSQYVGMGRVLYETQPTFRQTFDHCDDILRPYLEKPLVEILGYNTSELLDSAINETAYTQPALFALEYTLFKLWQSWGIEPAAVMGHSIGEYVAACVAGVFSLEDGLKLIAARGRLMQTLCKKGDMLVLSLDETQAAKIIKPYAQDVSIATINGPQNVVISGKHEAIETIMAALNAKGIKTKRLQVSHAFHSPLMEPMLAEFERVASQVTYTTPSIPISSNVTGELATDEIATPAYWCRHVRQPVRFAASMETLYRQGYEIFMEIGPKPSLLGMGRLCLPEGVGTWLASLRQDQDDWQPLLQSFGELYVHGVSVNWSGFDQDYSRRKIPLPTYPFQRQSYWISRKEKSVSTRSQLGHPLLGQQLYLAGTQDIYFEAQINIHSPAYLAHHRVYQSAIMPASAFLEMGLAAGASIFKSVPLLITDVAIEQALILPEEEETTVQVVLTPLDPKKYTFKIFSLSSRKPILTHHASGRVGMEPIIESELSPVDLAQLRAQCAESFAVATHYQQCQEQGLNYGSRFQAIKQLFLGESAALGQIHLPESLVFKAGDYHLHPVLLDACFQVLIAAASISSKNKTYLPVAIEQLHLYRHPGESLWCHAQLIKNSNQQTLTADLSLFDDSGVPIAKIKGLSVKRANRETLQRHFQTDSDDLYEMVWQAQGHPFEIPSIDKSGNWLIFADNNGLGQTLAKLLEEQGESCHLAYIGSAYENKDNNIWHLNPSHSKDFKRLFQEGAPPLKGIIHLWSLDAANTTELTTASLAQAQILGCGSVLHLLQAQVKQNQSMSPRLWLVTRNAISVEPKPLAVAQAPLWGLGKVIALEHPELWGGLIDLPSDNEKSEAAVLLAAILDSKGENQMAIRNVQRYVARLVRHRQPASIGMSLHADNSYLITGGLGALGLKIAQWMVEQGVRHLVLTGRRGASSEAQEILNQLEKTGAKILVTQADVSKKEEMVSVFERMNTSMPPLRGIIHAAGFLDDGILLQQNWARFSRVMAAKIEGSWNLHILTQHLPLDFFVCFSSAASLLGSGGQGNYAAANAFMDALAHHRSSMGLPGLSINWGAWAESGMAANLENRDQSHFADRGINTIAPKRGLQILGALLGQESVQVGVLPINWSKFIQQFPIGNAPPLFSELAQQIPSKPDKPLRHQLESTSSKEEYDQILMTFLEAEVARVLKMTPSQLDVQQTLSSQGLDSLMAVELRTMMKNELDIDVPMVNLMEGISVTDLTTQIKQQLTQAHTSPTTVATAQSLEEQMLTKIDQMNDEEMDALLNSLSDEK
jgi:malonyl CoA-acyl carrier protein transacylase